MTLKPIVVPTGDAAPCVLRHLLGTFTSLGGLATYVDEAPGNDLTRYELRIVRRGKHEVQQWYREVPEEVTHG